MRLDWALRTEDAFTGEILREYDHLSNETVLQNSLGSAYHQDRDYTMVSSGLSASL